LAAVPSIGRATEVEPRPAPAAAATQLLYERYARQVYTFCLHRLGSREEAEDAVQSTFLNAFRGLSRGIVPESEAAWLFKIAENVCLTRYRSTRRRGAVESPTDVQALQDVIPARELGGGDELMPLGDALAAMPESQRRAILLREWQGLSYREIADEMELSQSAVETLIFRARRSLASGLEAPWRDRAPKRLGRRAFDLGSLFAALKGLFGGATVAKLAAVTLVAATGTAALAGAERRDPPRAKAPASAPSRSDDQASAQPDAGGPSAGSLVLLREGARGSESARGAGERDAPAATKRGKPLAPGAADDTPAAATPSEIEGGPSGRALGHASVPPGQSKEKSTAAKGDKGTPPGQARASGRNAPARPEAGGKPKEEPKAEQPAKAEKPEKTEKPEKPENAGSSPPPPPPPSGPPEDKGAGKSKDG
jgi:RNA polymerase sigma factor (sigma-70 family)